MKSSLFALCIRVSISSFTTYPRSSSQLEDKLSSTAAVPGDDCPRSNRGEDGYEDVTRACLDMGVAVIEDVGEGVDKGSGEAAEKGVMVETGGVASDVGTGVLADSRDIGCA